MKLVAKILALLKLDDKGKLEKFFSRIEKKFKKDMESLKHNKETLSLIFKGKIADLNDALEDAKSKIEDSLVNGITVEDLKDNNTMDIRIGAYLSNIKKAEEDVEYLEGQIKQITESHTKEITEIDEQISYINGKIVQICQ